MSKAAAVHHKYIPIDMVDMAAYFHKECPDQLHICNNLPVLIQDDFLDDEIFEGEVFCAIKRLKQNKAPGLDELPPELFKAFNNELIVFLTRIFNVVFSRGIFPLLVLLNLKEMRDYRQITEESPSCQ